MKDMGALKLDWSSTSTGPVLNGANLMLSGMELAFFRGFLEKGTTGTGSIFGFTTRDTLGVVVPRVGLTGCDKEESVFILLGLRLSGDFFKALLSLGFTWSSERKWW